MAEGFMRSGWAFRYGSYEFIDFSDFSNVMIELVFGYHLEFITENGHPYSSNNEFHTV